MGAPDTGGTEALRRILYVLPYVPSPIRVRPYQLIRHLARRGHAITIVALEDSFADPAALRELESLCEAVHIVPHGKRRALANCLAAVATPTPLWAAFTRSPDMSRLLRRLSASGRFDVAHVEHLRAAHFARDLGPLPRIIDAVDCITALRRQMLDSPDASPRDKLLSWEEWVKLRRYEPHAYRAFARVAVTSAFDAGALAALDPVLTPARVIPNGVDLDYFRPDGDIAPDPYRIVFSGKMSYQANDDAARFLLAEVLPRLRALRPGVKLTIAGSRPTAALQSLAARTEDVEVTGYVDDLRPYLTGAALALCPLRIGVGIQNKVLEAMAMGRPVVCTPLAARALSPEALAGEAPAVRVADNADGLARLCAELLARPQEARTAGDAALRYVKLHHSWENAADRFTALYTEVSHSCVDM
jgi:glycosyltransferase involved in cell wall biosynthesis